MRSLWIDPDAQRYGSLGGDVVVDVAIVGGGLSGMGAAYALRDSGAQVVVLEERTIASGASGRNAGFLLAGPAMSHDRAVQQVGLEMANRIWRFTTLNNRFIASIIDDLEIDCGFLRRGSLSLAASEDEWLEMRRALESLQQSEIAAVAVEQEFLPRPFDRVYCGGLYYPGNGELNPGAFVVSVAEHLATTIQIYERTAVESIDRGTEWVLRTSGGTVRARQVIIATNAYTQRLLPDVPIVPRRGQVLATMPLGKVVAPFPMYANHGYQYWRQTSDGRLVVGGWRDLDLAGEIGTSELLHPGIQPVLDDFVTKLAGEPFSIEHRWSGAMGFTPDLLPLVGSLPDYEGMWIAAGYSGHGVSMAFTCGMQVARAVVGFERGKPDTERVPSAIPRCFDPARFRGTVAPTAGRN